jgi:tetratricopeptide (TPR) repeat protein
MLARPICSEADYRAFVATEPQSIEARASFAVYLLGQRRIPEALALLAEALAIDHEHVPTLLLVAIGQHAYGNRAEARAACSMVIARQPGHREATILFARLLLEDGEGERAEELLAPLLAADQEATEARLLLAACLKSVGRFEEAEAQLERVIARGDAPGEAYLALADLEIALGEDVRLQMAARLADDALPVKDRIALHYALGRSNDGAGEFDRAFEHYAAGAALVRGTLDYDEPDMLAFFDEVMAVFGAGYADRSGRVPVSRSATPVFIVGMPRSGSTLVEQVLSRHPHVRSEGESRSFEQMLAGFRCRNPDRPFFPQLALSLSDRDLDELADQFRRHVRQNAGDAAIFVNKLPGNLLFAGLIRAVLPEARFIATRRDARDCCLSCFTTLFAESIDYSYDLAELGRYARKSDELLKHWSRQLPEDCWMELAYEDFVADPERQSRRLFGFLGLQWSDEYLEPGRSSRHSIRTASAVQVRRPVNRNSIGRWRRYERHLAPLLQALEGEP